MLRLTKTERAVAEITAIAEHVASLTAAAAGLRVPPDVPAADSAAPAPLVPLVDPSAAGEASATLGEIAAWSGEALGVDRAPAIWRALAHQPKLLTATWRKDRVVLGAGVLDPLARGCAALAVAQFRESTYFIPYYTQLLRHQQQLDDRAIVEVAGAVMHYVSFNTIAHGTRLESPAADITAKDVAEGGPLEHLVPGVKKRPPTA